MVFTPDVLVAIGAGFCLIFTLFQVTKGEYRMSLLCLAVSALFLAGCTGYQILLSIIAHSLAGLYFGSGALFALKTLSTTTGGLGGRYALSFSMAIFQWLIFLLSLWEIINTIVRLA